MSTLLGEKKNIVLTWTQDDEVGLVSLGDCETTSGDCNTRVLMLCYTQRYTKGVWVFGPRDVSARSWMNVAS